MPVTCLLLAATALVALAGCRGASEPPPAAPLMRCIAIPNGLAECGEVPGPTLPGPAAR